MTVSPTAQIAQAPASQQAAPSMVVGSGFQNFGATCYMNASMQALIRQRRFAVGIPLLDRIVGNRSEFSVLNKFAAVIEAYRSGLPTSNAMRGFYVSLLSFSVWNCGYSEQCDATEFIAALVGHLEKRFSELTLADAATAISNSGVDVGGADGMMLNELGFHRPSQDQASNVCIDFGISMKTESTGQCIGCDGRPIGNKFQLGGTESMKFFYAELTKGSLERAFDAFSAPVVIEGYRLNGMLTRIQRRDKIITFPKTMMVQVARFTYDAASGATRKKDDKFCFTQELTLQPSPSASAFYGLTAIIAHRQSGSIGHYVEYNLIDGKWYKFNDNSVTKVTNAELRSLEGGVPRGMNAYVLFYERRDAVAAGA
jgi:ubiquitin C-terminal hydrolase